LPVSAGAGAPPRIAPADTQYRRRDGRLAGDDRASEARETLTGSVYYRQDLINKVLNVLFVDPNPTMKFFHVEAATYLV
jgi:hypothetical protein